MTDLLLGAVWLVPVLTVLAFVLSLFLGRFLPGKGGWLTLALTAAAGIIAVLVTLRTWGSPFDGAPFVQQLTWFTSGSFTIHAGVYVDNLTAFMIFVVGVLTTLIVVYSQAYMRHDREDNWTGHHDRDPRPRYYAEMALFITGMFGFVLASNLLEAFVFWEIMGLCSYLLIGYWYVRPSAARAATKAFLVTRVGDLFFLGGLAILLATFGSLDYSVVLNAHVTAANRGLVTAAMAFFFVGAIGKSAQVPLHLWLPDAMEGPSTVSALIHAATMVKAGVYLVARMYPLMIAVPSVLLAVAVIGGITAFIAASMALVNNDLKRVLAYSTISQIGYMFLGLGAGAIAIAGYTFGLFHLFNHAFFKALLFLGAGSVGHAVSHYDMRKMGGLHKRMRWTSITMLLGGLSLAAIFPLGGYWSKDELLSAAYEAANQAGAAHPGWWGTAILLAWVLGIVTALMTAFYIFRAWFLTFGGTYRGEDEEHLHESPTSMVGVLVVLALFVVAGVAFLYVPTGLTHFLVGAGAPAGGIATPSVTEILTNPLGWLSLGAAILGIAVAWYQYRPAEAERHLFADDEVTGVKRFLYRRWYWNELYYWLAHRVVYGLAKVLAFFDDLVLDVIVDWFGRASNWLGERWRRWTTGSVSDYAATVVTGLLVLVLLALYLPTILGFLTSLNLLPGGI